MGKGGLWYRSTGSCPIEPGADTIYSFGGGWERKCTQYSALPSDYNLSFNFLKMSGKSIEGSCIWTVPEVADGKWQSMWGWWGLLAGDLEMLTQVAGHGKGCPTCACLCPEHAGWGRWALHGGYSVSWALNGAYKGMNYSAAEWSEQLQTREEEDITSERCEILHLYPREWCTLGCWKESRPNLVCPNWLCGLIWRLEKAKCLSLTQLDNLGSSWTELHNAQ